MTELRDGLTAQFSDIKGKWSSLHEQTTMKLKRMKEYYGNVVETPEVFERAQRDKEELNEDLKSHKSLAELGSSDKRDLQVQIETSEHHVQNMSKYGPPAAVFFTILGAGIGGAVGAKAPGLGAPLAIGVGIALGLFLFGMVSLVLYLCMKRKYGRQLKDWQNVKKSNEECLLMIDDIEKKKSCLNEIHQQLGEVPPSRMRAALKALDKEMDKYLQ